MLEVLDFEDTVQEFTAENPGYSIQSQVSLSLSTKSQLYIFDVLITYNGETE